MVAGIIGFMAVLLLALYTTFWTGSLMIASAFLQGVKWIIFVSVCVSALLWWAVFSIAPFSVTFGG